MTQRRLLVTSALPYANGSIHIGHLVEYLQTDIWVRFQKLRGNDCRYMCADDTHGTAIMIRAKQEGRSEEELIAAMQAEHEQDFADFGIEFDNYGSTNSNENRQKCHEIWASIRKAGLVKEKIVEQLFDPEANTFLADRFVKGTCPKCNSPDQYGDNCDKCGSTYSPADLIDPVSTLSGATPEVRSALHLFIELEQLHEFLNDWTQTSGALQGEVANYLKGHFLKAKDGAGNIEPLRDWDISRPAPYFGFEIPDSPGNYWYVWFDAPIGYMASTQQWCDRTGENFDDWWKSPDCEVHHFIGKDITYFHTLFWPGMLKTAGFSLPTKVHIHGFLTVDGEKMSKSKGTFIKARTYLNHLDPAYLRYFYAAKLSSKVDDIDLSLDEFIAKVNTDLVGKVVNLASRSAKFLAKTGLAERYPEDGGLFENGVEVGEEIAKLYEACEYSKAMKSIIRLADRANAFIEKMKPWEVYKQQEISKAFARSSIAAAQDDYDVADFWQSVGQSIANEETTIPADGVVRDQCTIGINLFRQIAIYLAPVLPKLAEQTGKLLGEPIASWDQASKPQEGTPVNKFKHMLKRIEESKVNAMIEESKAENHQAVNHEAENTAGGGDQTITDPWADSGEALASEPLAEECTIDDFMQVDLRVARIVEAEEVPEARKLLKLRLSLGGGVYKQVFAGIKAAYEPEKLVGRLVVCVANLKPRQMKFGLSEGMVAAAGPGGGEVYLLTPDEGAKPGQRLH